MAYHPYGVTNTWMSHTGSTHLDLSAVECVYNEIPELILKNDSTLKIFIVSTQQYAEINSEITKILEKKSDDRKIGFLVVDNPYDSPTIRSLKTCFPAVAQPWLLGRIRGRINSGEWNSAIQSCIKTLYLSSLESKFNNALILRDLEAKAMNDVGQAMASQATMDEILRLILEKSMELCLADCGFLFLKENLFGKPQARGDSPVKLLRNPGFRYIQKARSCKSQNIRISPELLDPRKSSFTSTVVNRGYGVAWNENQGGTYYSKDEIIGENNEIAMPELEFEKGSYRIKSLSVFPVRSPSEEIIGFVLLINRRVSQGVFLDSLSDIDNWVGEFDSHDLNILESLANQAGISIEYNRLMLDLKNVFESFAEASVVAIESRDPTTKGHSERVALLSCSLAEAVNICPSGPYANMQFSSSQIYELKYASLLHDFGKIGVREAVLRKEKKLYSHELNSIKERFMQIEKELHLKCLESYLEGLMKRGAVPTQEDIGNIHNEVKKITEDLNVFWEAVCQSNEPHVVRGDSMELIAKIAKVRVNIQSADSPLLELHEVEKLTIRKGSLSPEERVEIENHVTHSYRFLTNIPWTNELANLSDIVYAHHERLDGSGYPRKLGSEEIPVQAKIMAIADIYDALVAMDRPYKKAIPHERALSILDSEVKEGKLDKDLFEIFVDARIGDIIKGQGSSEAS
jgi:HD-GYP domain-containing protein (c-di-GMP phosphodiesterase class II)